MVETRGTLPKALWPGVKAWWGQDYKKHNLECEMVFDKQSSEMAFEEDVELTGYGLVPQKSEGGASSFDTLGQGPTTRYTNITWSLGYTVTEEEFDDGQYEKVARARTKGLSFSFRTTKEIVCANVFNRGFNASYPGGDGVSMLNASHPTVDGVQSNVLPIAADLSESSLEDLLKIISRAKNSRGLEIALKPKQLVVPPELQFDATRIVRSTLQSGSETNDINAMRSMGVFTKDPMIWHYLTDEDGWFVTTDAPDALKLYQRKERTIRRDNDFDTDNLKVKGIERFSVGHTDWRGVYGTEGAA